MREIALFGEDFAHQRVIGALAQRLADECGIDVRPDWRNAVRGHGRVVREFNRYLRDLAGQGTRPDLIVGLTTDANCRGLNERAREIGNPDALAPTVLAVPDPHIERWLLLDGAAFRSVFGKGCDAPDRKCDRDRYKQRLAEAIHTTGITPILGGIEFAEDIVQAMDVERAMRADRSLERFVSDLRAAFRRWRR